MPDPSSLIDEWTENLLRDLDPVYALESLWSRLGLRPQPGPQTDFLGLATVANIPPGMRILLLHRFHDELIGYLLRAVATRYKFEITGAKIARGDTGNMKYYGFVAKKSG